MSNAPELTQAEANTLFAMPKRAALVTELTYPGLGQKLNVDLTSLDGRESFHLDIGRSYVKLTRATFQTRARTTITLARVDLDGAPHTNPDGEELPCPHLHLYREGYGDKWAYPVPGTVFGDLKDRKRVLLDFLVYCSIKSITFKFDLLS